jgi:hypothetical protein
MNQNAEKGKREHTLSAFINKINKTEQNTFGNYYVNFNEMFNDNEYQK